MMGETPCLKAVMCARATLPPGCRFYPSEEQLLSYYLTNKNANTSSDENENIYGCNLIRELDLYDHDPFELPAISCFSYGYRGRKRHWYCYTASVVKETRGKSRKTKSGYWRRKGRVRNVFANGGNAVVGTRTKFVFYLRNSLNNAVKTNWTMYEYALVDHLKASFVLCRVFVKPCLRNSLSENGLSSYAEESVSAASFVLCRVFVKPCLRNSLSENGLSSYAEESVSAARHIGIQHDGYVTPDIVAAKMSDDTSIDRNNEISVYPLRPANELDSHQVLTAPVSPANFQNSPAPQGSQQARFSGLLDVDAMSVEDLTSQHLLSILEADFIELDDLT
ncbi:hypothetical protein L6164_015460 [Bauhinia variegata]|uniref:Uncharacterized protein n=1 Tax=Bauhinia variegata TaxID=167791 RepID=A0ACB9NLY3_BAUVA|nr:hypothetical protein L6164_015460 [Bauhinia variegata]